MLRELVDLACPVACIGCAAAGEPLCAGCEKTLRGLTGRAAVRVAPQPAPPGLPPVWALGPYDGVLREAIVAHKDGGRLALRAHLARLLRVALASALEQHGALCAAVAAGDVLLLPVPSSARSVRVRGRDPWREVVDTAFGSEPVPVRGDALRLTRRVRDQAGLRTGERFANLSGALAVRRPALVRGRTCVVLDDVMTTGATLLAAAEALRACDATAVHAVVLAATSRRPPTRGQCVDDVSGVD